MSSTAPPRCPACDDQRELCDVCGGRVLVPLVGPASVRGARWAEAVVRLLVARWPVRWPRSPRALSIAVRHVADLAASQPELQQRLARVCLEAAGRRYAELTDYLVGRRLAVPREPPLVDDGRARDDGDGRARDDGDARARDGADGRAHDEERSPE